VISLDIILDFLLPKFRICNGPFEIQAIVTMPETSVNKHQFSPAWKYNVRFTGKVFGMESVTISMTPQLFLYNFFRMGVFLLDAGHIITSLFRGVDIHYSVLLETVSIPAMVFAQSTSGCP
jgi:hypothetical protein